MTTQWLIKWLTTLHSPCFAVCYCLMSAGDLVVEYMGHLVRPRVADMLEARTYNQMVGAGERQQGSRHCQPCATGLGLH
jgi:hypothetical protein